MFETSIKFIQHSYPSKQAQITVPVRFRRSFQLLYLLVTLNIIFFLIVYHRLILITAPFRNTSIAKETNKENEQSSSCFIPQFDPWDQTIAKSLRIKPLYRCPSNRQNLINVINFTQLFFNQTVNRTYYSNSISHCLYFKIDRNPEEKSFRDWSYTLSEPILIENGHTEPILDADYVLTRCYKDRASFFQADKFCGYNCSNEQGMNESEKQALAILRNRTLVYEYVHPIIRLKKPAFSRNAWLDKVPSHFFSKSALPDRPPPSVIMIILDAVSDLQAQRALPRTIAYLKTVGLYTFQQHAIVGDGTFENIVPMFFGQPAADLEIPNINDSRYEFTATEIETDPKTKKQKEVKKVVHYPGPYDNYSFILKNFSRLNYTTFFSEEWRESAFYNLKNGFRQAPTDFYLRPYWLSLYETLSYNQYPGNSNPKPCYLDKLLHFLSLNWLRDFLHVHHQSPNYPTFGVMKLNEMSHDYLERLFWIDGDLKQFFEDLVERELLENTILIFCGDHGHRQHQLRMTRVGSFEVKLPFFSMLLPQSFKQDFPQAVQNLEKNQERLTSWWDVYETFANILKMVEEPHLFDPLRVNWHPRTSGISLFHPIPQRNCSSAGVPEKYCPCTRATPVDITLSIVKDLTIASIDHINNILLKEHQHLCIQLELKTIIRAEVEDFQMPKEIMNNTSKPNFSHSYTVLFEVSPSDGIFESRLLYDQRTKTIQLHSDILRINLYGQTSSCIRDKYDLRSFCYCFSYHRRLRGRMLRRNPFPVNTTRMRATKY